MLEQEPLIALSPETKNESPTRQPEIEACGTFQRAKERWENSELFKVCLLVVVIGPACILIVPNQQKTSETKGAVEQADTLERAFEFARETLDRLGA